MRDFATVILAAGKGTRMKSSLVKVLHRLIGQPMLSFSIDTVKKTGSRRIVIVIGYQGELVKETFKNEKITFVEQEEQLGTGHAVSCAEEELKGFLGDVLILCGDVPLIKEQTITSLLKVHNKKDSKITVLTVKMTDPTGYGRIIRGVDDEILRIVEEKDADDEEREVKEVNSGIYCVDSVYLFDILRKIGCENNQGEYYLTDIVAIANNDKERVIAFVAHNPNEVMGINTRGEMAKAGEFMRREILEKLMAEGVSIVDPKTTYIEKDVQIGRDTVVSPLCNIRGKTIIGKECGIEQGCVINDSEIGDRVKAKPYCVITESKIAGEVNIGPFAHVRHGTCLDSQVKTGSFVEAQNNDKG